MEEKYAIHYVFNWFLQNTKKKTDKENNFIMFDCLIKNIKSIKLFKNLHIF